MEAVDSYLNEIRKSKGLDRRFRGVYFTKAASELQNPRSFLLGIAGSVIVSFVLAWWAPTWTFGESPLVPVTKESSVDILQVMWQVHIAVAAIALPMLVFSIDRVRDRPGVVLTSEDVLIRETGIAPILIGSLFVSVRFGHDVLWFSTPANVVLDYLVLALIVFLTISAFGRSLLLITSRERMQRGAKKVVRDYMERVATASIRTRIANNRLFKALEEVEVEYFPFRERAHEPAIVVSLPGTGRVTDVHLGRLKSLISRLRQPHLKARPVQMIDELDPSPPEALVPAIWVKKRIGDVVTEDDREFLRLDRATFSDVDLKSISKHLAKIVRLE